MKLIKVFLSKESYVDKKDVTAAIGPVNDPVLRQVRQQYGRKASHKISLCEQVLTPHELYMRCIHGYTLAHVFSGFPAAGTNKAGRLVNYSKKDGSFTFSAKCNEFFSKAWCMVADIDHTAFPTAGSYLACLSKQPTFWYTTFSHTPTQPRFRLVYVLSRPLVGVEEYTRCMTLFNARLSEETGEAPDACNQRPAQYYNGTCISNLNLCTEHGFTGNIYFPEDIMAEEEGHTHLLSNLKHTTSSIQPFTALLHPAGVDHDLLDDIRRDCPFSELLSTYGYRYPCFYRMCDENAWTNGMWQLAPQGYFKLPFSGKTVMDGNRRRAKVAMRMCLRRIIRPDATVNDLIMNARADVERQYDNSDRVFTSEWYRSRAESAMQLTLAEIENRYSDTLAALRAHAPKDHILLKSGLCGTPSEGMKLKQRIKFSLIAPHYNPNLSLRENLDNLNSLLPFTLSLSTLQRFVKQQKQP